MMALLRHEKHRNHLECIILTRLRWNESVILPTDHVGTVEEDHHVENDVASVIDLCSGRGVRLEDGLRQTVQESDKRIRYHNDLALPQAIHHNDVYRFGMLMKVTRRLVEC